MRKPAVLHSELGARFAPRRGWRGKLLHMGGHAGGKRQPLGDIFAHLGDRLRDPLYLEYHIYPHGLGQKADPRQMTPLNPLTESGYSALIQKHRRLALI